MQGTLPAGRGAWHTLHRLREAEFELVQIGHFQSGCNDAYHAVGQWGIEAVGSGASRVRGDSAASGAGQVQCADEKRVVVSHLSAGAVCRY